MKIIVLANQNLFDLSLQLFGDVRAVFDLALENNLSITEDLIPGEILNISGSSNINIDVKAYFSNKKYHIATVVRESSSTSEIDYLLPQTLPHI